MENTEEIALPAGGIGKTFCVCPKSAVEGSIRPRISVSVGDGDEEW